TFKDKSITNTHSLVSFPTRRSPDLYPGSLSLLEKSETRQNPNAETLDLLAPADTNLVWESQSNQTVGIRWSESQGESTSIGTSRSEEHTSELQSRENLVCRLLLEKK